MIQFPERMAQFDIWNSAVLAQLPLLKTDLDNTNLWSRGQVGALANWIGPIPLKLQQFKYNAFKDMMFNWVINTNNELVDHTIIAVQNRITDSSLYHLGSRSELLNELNDFVGLGQQSLTHQDADDLYRAINAQVEQYKLYHAWIAVVEKSDVVETLGQHNASYQFERRNDFPLLVVHDPKIGLLVKLAH